jgi:hypothetical protein
MPQFIPVEHDPFGIQYKPVDHDPWGGDAPQHQTAFDMRQQRLSRQGLPRDPGTRTMDIPTQMGASAIEDIAAIGPVRRFMDANAYDTEHWGEAPTAAGPAAETAMLLTGGGMGAAEKGAAGIFGGRLAKGADLAKLERAMAMDAEGAETADIWAETKWHKFFPDEWGFEIPDEGLQVAPGRPASLAADWPREPISPSSNAPWLWTPPEAGYGAAHPKLLEAYPDLQDVQFNLSVDPESSRGGYYRRPRENRPAVIQVTGGSAEDLRSVTAHELQHAVDDVEGRLAENAGGSEWARKVVESMPFSYEELPNELRYKISRESYLRLKDEVRARNVQKRLDMSPEERARTDPSETQDYRNSKQIPNYEPYWINDVMQDMARANKVKAPVGRMAPGSRSYSGEVAFKPVDHDPFGEDTSWTKDPVKDGGTQKFVDDGSDYREPSGGGSITGGYPEFRRSGNVEDRRHEAAALRQNTGDESGREPADLSEIKDRSALARALGIDDLLTGSEKKQKQAQELFDEMERKIKKLRKESGDAPRRRKRRVSGSDDE